MTPTCFYGGCGWQQMLAYYPQSSPTPGLLPFALSIRLHVEE